MAIKIYGNSKFQGKSVFEASSPTPFSPEQITGLRGWYDAAEGTYMTNGNDFVDSTAPFALALSLGSDYLTTTTSVAVDKVNTKNSYSFVGLNSNNRSTSGTVQWSGSSWTCNYTIAATYDEESGDLVDPEISNQVTATGNTDYPWQANWGTGTSATRAATTNSTAANVGDRIAKWKNKVGNLSNVYDGHLTQGALVTQPILRTTFDTNKKYVEFNNKGINNTLFTGITTPQRTYYIVAFQQGSTINAPVLASSASTLPTARRNALSYSSSTTAYGLSQGTNKFSAIATSFTDHIVCASFNSSATGKISVNNSLEETLTGIGTSFAVSPFLFVGANTGSGTLMNVKEILFFEGAHTTEQKTQVINYLNAKHNVF